MKNQRLVRQEILLGEENIEKLQGCTVAVVGIGGVGCGAVEALARGGIGHLVLMDFDCVEESNKNRQLVALDSTIGQNKARAMANRVTDIDKNIKVTVLESRFCAKDSEKLFELPLDYIIDAIDIVTNKIELIVLAHEKNVPIISAMGTGNKKDSTQLVIGDLSKTSICPLARVLRRELKGRGIYHSLCLYSKEVPMVPKQVLEQHGRHSPGSLSFVPPVAGMMMAGRVIFDLIEEKEK